MDCGRYRKDTPKEVIDDYAKNHHFPKPYEPGMTVHPRILAMLNKRS